MSIGHAINGAGLLTPLGLNIVVTKQPSNQITNTNNKFLIEVYYFNVYWDEYLFGGFPLAIVKL